MADEVDLSQLIEGDGNTKSPSIKKKQGNVRCYAWFLTWNNYLQSDLSQLKDWADKNAKKYAFQEETGENKTPHLQGAFHFKSQRFFNALCKLWPKAHWEKLRNQDAGFKYCLKAETCTGKKFTKGIPKDPLSGKNPYPYQTEILELIKKEPDDRTIHWYWDAEGNKGKSTLVKSVIINNDNAMFFGGKCADIMCAAMLHMEENELKIALVDLTRSDKNTVSYKALESLKNGLIFSGKYESKAKAFDPPHVIVFANYPPILEKMSKDRWHVVNCGITQTTLNVYPSVVGVLVDTPHGYTLAADSVDLDEDELAAALIDDINKSLEITQWGPDEEELEEIFSMDW
nr:MAG: replication associated protein [Arizlama virus]